MLYSIPEGTRNEFTFIIFFVIDREGGERGGNSRGTEVGRKEEDGKRESE